MGSDLQQFRQEIAMGSARFASLSIEILVQMADFGKGLNMEDEKESGVKHNPTTSDSVSGYSCNIFNGNCEVRFYVLLVPAELHFPSTEQICLQMDADTVNRYVIHVTVTLEVTAQVIQLHSQTVRSANSFRCYSFKISKLHFILLLANHIKTNTGSRMVKKEASFTFNKGNILSIAVSVPYCSMKMPSVTDNDRISLHASQSSMETAGQTLMCQVIKNVPSPHGGQEEVAVVRIVGTGDIQFKDSKYVLIRRVTSQVVIQTDKPTYRPGQTVFFRIVTLDENFISTEKKYPLVELKDSDSNRVAQWLDIKTNVGIVDLSFNLATEPLLGIYTINVDSGKALKTFIVQEEVLPRFEVTIEKPSEIFMLDSFIQVKVCGRYTYGRGVEGIIRVDICRYSSWTNSLDIGEPCINVKGKTDDVGCFSTNVETGSFDLTNSGYFGYSIIMTAYVTENGTEVMLTSTKTFPVSFLSGKLKFDEMDPYYKVGHPYRITLVLLKQDGSPLPFSKVSLDVIFGNQTINIVDQTNNRGRIRYILDTLKWSGSVNINGYFTKLDDGPETLVKPYYDPTYYTVLPYYSEARSFLRMEPIFGVIPCRRSVRIRVEYELNREDLRPNLNYVYFSYIVIGKAGILLYGQKVIFLTKKNPVKGVLYVPIIFTSYFAPAPKMIGYIILNNGTMAADRLHFNVEMCFPNKVQLNFSQTEALPKSLLYLHVLSTAASMCAIRAVDKSVLISYTDQELTSKMVYDLFPLSERSGYDYRVDEIQTNPCWTTRPWFFGGFNFKNPWLPPNPWETEYMDILMQGQMSPGNPQAVGDGDKEITREYFPETWIWKLLPIGKTGVADLAVTVPDTITDWIAGAFCIGPRGFGLSLPTSLRAFQPFFVNLILPYSVVVGETFTLKASVFNYLEDCIKVSMPGPQAVQLSECKNCQYTSCVCPDHAVIFRWDIAANKVGVVDHVSPAYPQGVVDHVCPDYPQGVVDHVCPDYPQGVVDHESRFMSLTVRADAVSSTDTCEGKKIILPNKGKTDILKRQLLVKPGGVRKEITEAFFYCLQGSTAQEKASFSLQLPNVVVEGSVSAYITVMGDLLGSALENLDKLIVMPYGCGEQNMLTFAPIVYVLQYLEATLQLKPDLRAKAMTYLQSGYQRELTYKHNDGSFSAFGETDGDGSSWLTAFVVKCFAQARAYIFIDDNVINNAVEWLGSLQQAGGCFVTRGTLIHTLMKGGVEDDVSLSAYITAALLELKVSPNNAVLANALSCLRSKVPTLTNPYTQALLAYTFSLANDTLNRVILLETLYPLAETSDGQMYWEYRLESSNGDGGVSANVELTSYILLALVSLPDIDPVEIKKAAHIVHWLSKQQNPYGGFSSTQDTVVAIQAIAKYSKATFNGQSMVSVKVNNTMGFQKTFSVVNSNRLLQQTETLPNVPGDYSLLVSGSGCVFIQSVLKYNVYPETNTSTFDLNVNVSAFTCDNRTGQVLLINISVRYIGSNIVSNMVLIEVEMLSGFSLQTDITNMVFQPVVKKVSTTPNSVTVYLDKLTKVEETLLIPVTQASVVQNLKPAMIKVYDYYIPEENSVTSYLSPCV
ncbi:alpha-2-macroglobulin-like protein 1 [Pelodytes ibericus]